VRSFFGSGEVIEFVVDVEQALSKSSEFATRLVIFQLETKHLYVPPQLEMENAVVVKGRRSRSGHCSTRWLLHILRGQPISCRTPERFAPDARRKNRSTRSWAFWTVRK
jgi:hypothetical protein